MKKRIYIFILLLAASVSIKAQPLTNKDSQKSNYRNVYWIHGLSGDVNSLKTLSDYFREHYKINSYYPGYPTNRGVKEAAYQLSGLGIGLQRNDDIVIAHSMGGLVSRQYYKDFTNRRFGGIMTLNTPHQGAEFAQSFDNGKIKTFFTKVTTDGFDGYNNMSVHVADCRRGFHENVLEELEAFESLNETRNDITLVGVIAGNVLGNPLASWSVDALTNTALVLLVNVFTDALKDNVATLIGFAATTVFGTEEEGWTYSKDDLKPNSQIVTGLNNSPVDCPRIAITGTVDDRPGMRFLGSRLSAIEKDNPGIGDVDDGAFIKYANAIIKDSWKCKDEYARLYRVGSWLTLGLSNSYFSKRRDAFSRQARFWENGFEREFQKCLGSIYYTNQTQTYTVWENICNTGPIRMASMPIIGEDDDCWQLVTKTRTIRVQRMHPNDGIVTLPSQRGMAGPRYNIKNNDHEKVKRSQKTVDYIDSQFSNNNGYFYCERK
ncbi:MAG: esterase/lipase family protein [Bacteroidota bacterium]